jgi:hypothetical protein
MELRYELVVVVPDELDDTTASDIDASASEQDGTVKAKIARYIGGVVSNAESVVRDELPEDWTAYIVETS